MGLRSALVAVAAFSVAAVGLAPGASDTLAAPAPNPPCALPVFPASPTTDQALAPGVRLRSFDQGQLRLVHITVERPARLSVAAAAAALPLPVLEHVTGTSRAVAAVNAGYMSEQSRAVTGPLVSSGRILSLASRGFDGERTQRAALFPSSGGVFFKPVSLSGRLRAQGGDVPLVAVNDLEGLSRGVVLVNPLYTGTTPSRVTLPRPAYVSFVSAGKVTRPRELTRFDVSWGKLALVTTSLRWRGILSERAGSRAVPYIAAQAPRVDAIAHAVELGARLVLSGRPVAGKCQPAGAWESRPRLAVGTSGSGARQVVHLVAVRGPGIPRWNQYDSGATIPEMAHLLPRLGVEDAYALDAGASLQVAARSSAGKWSLRDRSNSTSAWQRPVPAALVVSAG